MLATRRDAVEVTRKRGLAPVPHDKDGLLARPGRGILLFLYLPAPILLRERATGRQDVRIARPGAGWSRREGAWGKQLVEYGDGGGRLLPGLLLPAWCVGRGESADARGATTPLAGAGGPRTRGPLREPAGGHANGVFGRWTGLGMRHSESGAMSQTKQGPGSSGAAACWPEVASPDVES